MTKQMQVSLQKFVNARDANYTFLAWNILMSFSIALCYQMDYFLIPTPSLLFCCPLFLLLLLSPPLCFYSRPFQSMPDPSKYPYYCYPLRICFKGLNKYRVDAFIQLGGSIYSMGGPNGNQTLKWCNVSAGLYQSSRRGL